jgi:glutaredoxin
MIKPIIYSTKHCPWCVKLKDFFKKNNIEFEERMADADPRYAMELEEKSGQSGVPVTDVNGKIIIGYNEPAIKKALGLL